MVYLYGALGIAMLSGIMAIFEMGLSLTGKSPLPMPKNNYLKSSEKIKEKDLFLFSNSNHPSYDDVKINSGLVGVNICNEPYSTSVYSLGCGISNKNFSAQYFECFLE